MRRRKEIWLSTVNVSTELEREDEALPLRGTCFVLYEVEGEASVEPPGGDGWNEPRYGASAEVYDPEVVRVEVTDEDGNEWQYDHKFIGPMEPGIVRPNHRLELTKSEEDDLAEQALEQACVDPYDDY